MVAGLTDIGWFHVETFGRGVDPAMAATGVDLCVIATPDEAIVEVARAVKPAEAVVMHLSGATPVTAIVGHRVAALHPLVSLADPATGSAQLRNAWFGIAGDPIAQETAESLSGKWFNIADDDRVLYHAAAAISANHLVALLGQVERLAAEVGVPMQAMLELARSGLNNVAAYGPSAALTGPASRGDHKTIERHRAEILKRLPAELPLYDALVTEARRLAGSARGQAD